jgi:serine/threonine-protein kinase
MKVDVARIVTTGDADEEPSRAFLQSRISLWTFWVFVLSFGFYLTNIATWPFLRDDRFTDMLLETANLDHLAVSLTFGAVCLVTRRWRLSMRVLRTLDVATLVIGCTLFAVMSAAISSLRRAQGLDIVIGSYAGLLACANTVMARAITVPSAPRKTLVASTAAMIPLIPAVVGTGATGAIIVNYATWCAISIAVATVGSRIIFGLRAEAARVRRLGQYTLETQIGAGGMGMVYRASHAMLRRPTAIKLLPPDRAGEANLVRFEREVQLTAQLSHPNTVAIYDYGRTPDGVFYYAMEYLDGINLEDLVRRYGPQPPGRVVAILDQVCGALAEAHERGLVHRDVKPANIILTERGGEPDVAKIVDFGLVKPFATGDANVTMNVATLLGTPLYLSPEAMTMPDAADPRSDLYALGAVGYMLLTGHPVFEAPTVTQIVAHHLHTEPTPPSRRTGQSIPGDLEAVVLQCLRKQAEDRPASARALRDGLRRCALVPPWTTEDAARWWRAFRADDSDAKPTPDAPHGLTVTVDIGDRVTHAL